MLVTSFLNEVQSSIGNYLRNRQPETAIEIDIEIVLYTGRVVHSKVCILEASVGRDFINAHIESTDLQLVAYGNIRRLHVAGKIMLPITIKSKARITLFAQ
ncbi:hypothetical protein M8J77_011218 [Diaphorina citri]|nr:hypothetical protein M8J77_011218 [Diaphorina citri]